MLRSKKKDKVIHECRSLSSVYMVLFAVVSHPYYSLAFILVFSLHKLFRGVESCLRAEEASKYVILMLGGILAPGSKPCFTVEDRKAHLGKAIYPRLCGIELFSVEHRGGSSFVGNGIK